MKGIILAGGSGTRMYPLTIATSKHLLPIYDKPMIYYPLSILMLSDVKDILIITTPEDLPRYKSLLGDGIKLGINLSYKIQDKPNGIGEAFLIGEDFIGDDSVILILGDNIFYGNQFSTTVSKSINDNEGATIFAYQVNDPQRFGVVEIDDNFYATSIEEKPDSPKSNYAVTGLYIYDNTVVDISKSIKPSDRGELEITAVNNEYLKQGKLKVEVLTRGFAWLDTGTHSSLLQASLFMEALENNQKMKVACVEEISLDKGWITDVELGKIASSYNNEYGEYLRGLIDK